jgi:hypothetical protein
MKHSRDILILGAPLLLGFVIYFSCRTQDLLYYRFIPFRELLFVDTFHETANRKCVELLGMSAMGDVVVFSLPAALYAFSLTYYFKKRYYLTFAPSRRIARLQILVSWSLSVAVFPELLQMVGILPGRFDPVDVGTASLAIFIAMIL